MRKRRTKADMDRYITAILWKEDEQEFWAKMEEGRVEEAGILPLFSVEEEMA